MRPQLLCTFTTLQDLPYCISNIHKTYNNDVANLKCYTYVYTENSIVCIYNVSSSDRRLRDTISINRKKETNTLYTINALNALIRSLNGGILDKTYVINWYDYKDCILLSQGDEYKTIPIKELSHS